MRKKLICLLMSLALFAALLPPVSAEEIRLVDDSETAPIRLVEDGQAAATNGSCGSALRWKLEGTTLTVSGSGAMTDWTDAGDVPWYASRGKIKSAVLQNGVSSVGAYAFYGCEKLSSVTLPDTICSFGYQSFRDCAALRSISLPDSLSELGTFSFYGSGLRKVTVPGSVRRIGGSFAYCSQLESAVLGEGVESLGDWAFRGCSSLKSVTLPDSLTSIGTAAFRECVSLRELSLPEGLRSIELWAFCGCALESVTLPEGITELGERVFENCEKMTSVSLPSTLTKITYMDFYGCSALPAVELPASLQTLAKKSFAACESLESVSFAGSVPEIGTKAFETVSAAVYYPADDASWTSAVRKSYGGSLSWRPCSTEAPPALYVDGLSTEGVALSWPSPGSEADRFVLERNAGSGWETLKTLSSESYTDKTVRMGERYAYRLRARSGSVWTRTGEAAELLFNPFSDIPSSGKTLEYVSWAYNNGVVKGSGPTRFAPDKGCTRIQFILMLWKMAGSQEVAGENPFSDISGEKTTRAIIWALDRRIINSGRRFDPDGPISRVQIVMILWKLAGSPQPSGTCPFTDVSGSKTTAAVLWAYQKGIAKGTSETRFSPDRDCTRIQLVIFLYKYHSICC